MLTEWRIHGSYCALNVYLADLPPLRLEAPLEEMRDVEDGLILPCYYMGFANWFCVFSSMK
jgi:hypothetical protein